MKYTNDWESINSRPVPKWFSDAKFGIFIHWGLYSVPAFAPKAHYAEWYWYALTCPEPDEAQLKFREYHKKTYGDKFDYRDFVKDFTADAFDADEWAKLFERSGAKYINLVSKHHDGYCLFKTDYAPFWNSVDVGPHRDFCQELKTALDKTDVRFGVYHSVYEWYHPLYLENPEKYALEHLIPMLKELVEKYQPATLFTDGEWAHPSAVWHSTDFLEWLYNESSVKDIIVPNDRWGSETRGKLGGNFTTEYGSVYGEDSPGIAEVTDGYTRPNEECRGIGGSFGFNKFETPEDYLSSEELVHMLIDLVSKGSNFLLNIGPTADGRIPVIMQQKLLDIGDWLRINGDGIYSTVKFAKSSDEKIRYTKKGDAIYAFILKFPFGSFTLNEIDFDENYKAQVLGNDFCPEISNDNGKLKLTFPVIDPNTVNGKYAY
ncbi:MAG: alpha-L-fucosidase, partial [Ruminococcus sp.]|nr:alpha-L-fucosidase [Candidatus Copronaster equi]